MGVAMGLVLVIFANAAPKTLEPWAEARCGPAKSQAVQRFAGWTLVLAGLGYSLAWLTLPIDRVNARAMLIVVAGVLLVAGKVLWAAMNCQDPPPAEL
ncbi:MAG: hypothetical protein ACE5GX_15005 [Thermoanaerobaculia bacterium]